MWCVNCGAEIPDGARFCASCGAPVSQPESASPSVPAAAPASIPAEPAPSAVPTPTRTPAAGAAFIPAVSTQAPVQTTPQTTVQPAAQPVYHAVDTSKPHQIAAPVFEGSEDDEAGGNWKDFFTRSLITKMNEIAGGTGVVELRYSDFFRSVFRRHEKGEAAWTFICGTEQTTPDIRDVSTAWPRPWIYSRVLLLLALVSLVFAAVGYMCDNFIGLAAFAFLAAMTAPVAVTVFFFECNALRNISFIDVVKMFLLGGAFSVCMSITAGYFFPFDMSNAPALISAALTAVVEEGFKLLAIIFFMKQLKDRNYILSGILVGAAIGGGTGAFATSGMILKWWFYEGFQSSLELAFMRAGLELGSHVAWGAIMGGAITLVSNGKEFDFAQIISVPSLVYLGIAFGLHFLWEFPLPMFSSASSALGISSQQTIISAFAWVVISILLNRGLGQVNEMAGVSSD